MRTTRTHFAAFKKQFAFWQQAFGLVDWKVFFEHAHLEDANANIGYDTASRTAIARLNKEIDADHPVNELALHEALHLLLADMDCRLDTAEESVVRTLEHVILSLTPDPA